ncbi:MAG: hypothetical protein AAGD32_10435 [Planctomycetota bacterium]
MEVPSFIAITPGSVAHKAIIAARLKLPLFAFILLPLVTAFFFVDLANAFLV